jgi:hypothetical protein
VRARGLERERSSARSGDEIVIETSADPCRWRRERAAVRLVPAARSRRPVKSPHPTGAIELDVPAGSHIDVQAQRGAGRDHDGVRAQRHHASTGA